ncbi:MAG: rRNA maturation RNase YbeY [Flammeovirgaceae bacterium]|nr:MAG: rRNA maturation RNase YbeY [Flammeovirgaceae bacterium]
MPIRYFCEGVQFQVLQPRKKSKWLNAVVNKEGHSVSLINIIFCSDSYLAKLNRRYLGHKTLTDTITFQYSAPQESIEGDIFISIPRVKENSKKFKVDFDIELSRVMVHGVLHLLGYSDKSSSDKAIMRLKEDTYLSLR